jgi:DNA-binding beta-propeller fold protein YncE
LNPPSLPPFSRPPAGRRLFRGIAKAAGSWGWLLFLLGFGGAALASGLQILRDVPSTFVYPADGFLPFNLHRGTATLLALMLPGANFDNPQGVACALLKSDHDPRSPDNDVVVTVIGVNSDAGQIFYNVGLQDIRSFGSSGRGDGQFLRPVGVAINTEGRVAVADTGNNRIALLHHDGLRLSWVKALGHLGTAPGEFNAPEGVAYDSQGRLYVADTGNNRIQVMDPDGRFRVLPTPPLEGPSAIAVIDRQEAWTYYQKGPYADRIAVIDRRGQRLETFTLKGAPLARVLAADLPDPPVRLDGCAFDYYGNLVATDFAKSCLRKFDKDLRYVVTFGSRGDGDFQFIEPRGIAINHQFGQMLVSERDSVQYFWNGADAVSLRADWTGKGFHIPFFLTERAFVTARIQDGSGTTVADLLQKRDMGLGPQALEWVPGPSLPHGTYYLQMRVMATYSSRDRIAKDLRLPVPYVN